MNQFPLVSLVKIKRARNFFFSQGTVPDGLVPEFIVRSWQRSVINGVSAEDESQEFPRLDIQELGVVKEENLDLLSYSLPVMESLYEHIIQTSSKVLLSDASGVVLHAFGDPDCHGKSRKVSLLPGGIWSEGIRGTNAIGTALVEREPVVVHSAEHFIASNHFLTCSAAPIFDPFGRMLGVLDVSGYGRVHQQHTMALVRISVQQIENRIFSSGFEHDLVLQFHIRPEFLGTMYEGIIVFRQDGRFLAANHTAFQYLELDQHQAEFHTFSSLFNVPLTAVFGQPGQFPRPVQELHTCTGITIFCRSKTRLIATSNQTLGLERQAVSAVASSGSAERKPLLENLELGDSVMRKIISRTRKILEHDIPVLLEGESGTGKEIFARAMHNSSSHHKGPFVALNCAALPEGLIESELFGYQEGAFTGAKRKGYSGKIRQADGGTLFLDEIGDMPLSFQARLLRVLQERAVSPLGGSESYQVHFALICATNRVMREEVDAGRFREDLYYRLNGMLVTLPSLRQRNDRLELARSIIHSLATPGRPISLSPQVIKVFESHPWPGNIRQMHSVLRTAVALLGYGNEITEEHFPEDFLEQGILKNVRQGISRRGRATTLIAIEGTSLEQIEKIVIEEAVRESRGNITAAARKLGICRSTLYRKMQMTS
ncbi:MAG: sigma-54-dependent Fis family transcriptional regulator [Desulfuromonadales bacterium]|nr:sigma-54-dependent Fis family transcriptional regulator [Desulfuromonadales bacterium]